MSDIYDFMDDDAAAPQALPDTTDAFYGEVEAEAKQARAEQVARSAKIAVRANPDVYGKQQELATALDLPVDLVARQQPRLEAAKRESDTVGFLNDNPEMADWYAQGDNAQAIKIDELRHTSGLKWLIQAPAEAYRQGRSEMDLADLRYRELFSMATQDEITRADAMSAARTTRTFGADGWFEKGFVGTAQMLPGMIDGYLGGLEGGLYGAGAGAIAGSVLPGPGTVAGAGTGFRLGSIAGQVNATFKQEAGLAYDDFRSFKDETGAPLDQDVAKGAAIVAGSANALLETLALRKLASVVPGMDRLAGAVSRDAIAKALTRPTVRAALGSFAKNIASTGATEVSTEMMQEAITIFAGEAAKAVENDDGGQFEMATAGEITDRLGDTLEQTLQTMTVLGPALSSSRLGHDVWRSQKATQTAATIEAIHAHAQGNELATRLPEKAKEAVRAATANGPVSSVYISPDAFSTYFQNVEDANAFFDEIGFREEFDEARRLGRSVELPIDDYYVSIAATDIGQAIQPFVKFDEEAMTVDEATRFNEAWQDAQQTLAEEYETVMAGDNQALEADERIASDVKQRAMNAGIVPDQADQYGKLYSAFFRVMGERSGVDAAQLYEGYGLDVRRALPQAGQFKAVDGTSLALEVMRRGRIPSMRKEVQKSRGRSLLEAIKDRGGIVDTGGELAAMGARSIMRPGAAAGQGNMLGSFNEFSADDTARALWEDGYFPDFQERPTPNDLYEAIGAELGGDVRYSRSMDDIDDPRIRRMADLVAYADTLDKLGLDPSAMSDEDIREALDAATNADPDNAALYQRLRDGVSPNAPEAGPTDSKAFKDWFGDSKVVDADGKPLVVYHGTAADFEAFDTKAEAKHIALPGIFFTPNASNAADFASSASRKEFRDAHGYIAGYEGAAIVPVYLSIQNPATIALNDRETGIMSGHAEVRAALEAAKANGHDGATITGWADGSGDVQYVAFEPTQIKSVNNRGTFDASDPRILYQADAEFATVAEQKALAKQMLDDLKDQRAAGVEADAKPAFAQMRNASLAKDALVDAMADTDVGVELKNASGLNAAVTRSQQPGGGWRVTYFGDSGFSGHTEHKTKREALKQAIFEGYDQEDDGALRRAMEARTFFQERTEGQPRPTTRGSIQLAPGRTIINMFDQADLSTFLHESGHFFLEVFRDLAMSPNAPEGILADWAATREYLGLGEAGELTTEAHEKFARTFEAYLFEGKAPSEAVANIFARFRSWLTFVYRSVRDLRAPINSKIRGVMDRMLASDEEIADVSQSPEFRPAFKDAAEAGMTEKQWADYVEAAGKAVDAARRDLDVRMLSEVSRETTREWRDAKRAIRATITGELENLPVYRVTTYLRTGNVDGIEASSRMFLDRSAIVTMFGEGALTKLPRGVPPIYRNKGGVHPDFLAELFGFQSGHEMLTMMMSVPPMARAINEEVKLRMRQQYGDLMGDAVARIREAQAATANDEKGDLLNAEIGVLVKKGLATSGVSKAQAKKLARELVRAKPIREAIRHKLYMAANAKAAEEAETAIRKGDWRTALSAKKRQLLNHYMAMEAREAEKETEAAVRYLGKFAGRKQPQGIWPEHLDRIGQVLERFDLRKSVTLKEEQRRSALSDWFAEQEALGEVLIIPDVLRPADDTPVEKARAEAFRKPFRALAVDDLMAVRDAIKNLEHIGRRRFAEDADAARTDFNNKASELASTVLASDKERPQLSTRNPTRMDEFVSKSWSLEAALIKVENLMDWFDRGDANGPFRRLIWQPLADAEAREHDLHKQVMGQVERVFSKLDKARLSEAISVSGSAQTYLRSDIMAIALNMGNASNLDKLLRGEAWSQETLNAYVANLNADEAQAVQEIWDIIDQFWPQISAMEKRLSGVAPPRVEAQAVTISGVELRGGYYPMKYDPRRSHDVSDRQTALQADAMFRPGNSRVETRHGFTKERSQSYTRPLLLDLDGLASHLSDVIHDVTHREAVLTAHKFLVNTQVRSAIESRYGVEYYNQLVPWLRSIAQEPYQNDGLSAWMALLRGVRSRATMMGMGLRITTMVTQLAGYSSSLEMVSIRSMAGAMKDFTASPLGTWEIVNSKSAMMRQRGETLDRDIREQTRALAGLDTITARARKFAFSGIGYMDKIVTVPTWMAAYREQLQREPGDEAGAVAHADKVVSLTQGAGGPKDLAAIQRNNEATKLLTMFYSYFSAYYNRQRAWGRDVKKKIASGEGDFATLLARQVFMTMGPAILANLLVGEGPEDDESWALWAAKKVAFYPLSALPVVRDAMNYFDKGYGYSFTPAARVVEEMLVQPIKMIGDIVDGDAEPRKVVKQGIETIGYVTKLPLGQLSSSIDNVWIGIEKDDFRVRDLVLKREKD